MATVAAKAGGRVRFDGLTGRDVFLYAVRGDLTIGGKPVPAFNLAELSDGDTVEIEAASDAVYIFGHAAPIDEPVVSHGPFVMNSAEEIRQAYADYRAGRFGVPV
jgi:redox-sensitive bicupin YhaK (pirin superfamily)